MYAYRTSTKDHAVTNYIISNINCVEYLKQMCDIFHCYFEQQMLMRFKIKIIFDTHSISEFTFVNIIYK